ncbi:MAG: hypothetical protein ABIS14_12820 [Sphingomonas sp.]
MQDQRTLTVLEMTVALLTSDNPNYNTREIADVSAEVLGSADGIDHVFGICACPPDEDGGPKH